MSPGPRCSRSTSRSGASSGGDEDRPPSTSASDSEDLPPPPYLSPEVVNNISKSSLELPYRSSDYSTVCSGTNFACCRRICPVVAYITVCQEENFPILLVPDLWIRIHIDPHSFGLLVSRCRCRKLMPMMTASSQNYSADR